MTWATLFERAASAATDVSVETIEAELAARRRGEGPPAESGDPDSSAEAFDDSTGPPPDDGDGDSVPPTGSSGRPDPARVVADADVLAADLLIGGDARRALDQVRAHRWVDLVASDPLLDDATAVVAVLAADELASDWRDRLERGRVAVPQPPGDHPGLASAAAGGAAHLLTFDEDLSSVGANLSIQTHLAVSIRTPHAFSTLFDPERLYPTVVGGEYPGPDADPRA
jgi:predicted nucleic acid-binding protein